MSVLTEQKRFVRLRAGNCCEYCRISQFGRLVGFQIDHIIAISHGGTNTNDNLCLSCYECNSYKGSNVAAIDPLTQLAARLYDPRQQDWEAHFEIQDDATLKGISPEGRTTIFVLRMNEEERVKQRLGELIVGDYPC